LWIRTDNHHPQVSVQVAFCGASERCSAVFQIRGRWTGAGACFVPTLRVGRRGFGASFCGSSLSFLPVGFGLSRGLSVRFLRPLLNKWSRPKGRSREIPSPQGSWITSSTGPDDSHAVPSLPLSPWEADFQRSERSSSSSPTGRRLDEDCGSPWPTPSSPGSWA